MDRISIIQDFVDMLGAETYLEIGVRFGDSFFPVRCKNKIGVDIVIPSWLKGGEFFEMTSDEFFEKHPRNFDVAFIDGDHTYEQSLRDAENCLKWMNPNGVVLLHDCNPTDPYMASPTLVYGRPNWCGEVWKTIVNLRTRKDLSVYVLDCDFGVGVVRKTPPLTSVNIRKNLIKLMTYDSLNTNRKNLLGLVEC